MIVIDEDSTSVKLPASQRQGATVEGSDVSENSPLAPGPPPAYSSTSYVPLQFPQDIPASQPRQRFQRGEKAGMRFFKAFAIAVGIWFLIALFIDTVEDFNIIIKLKTGNKRPKSGDEETPPEGNERNSDGRIRTPSCILAAHANSTIDDDTSTPDAPYSVKLGFSLPVTSDFAFFGNDSHSMGSFFVDVSLTADSPDVEVDVVISYRTPKALKRSKVCLFEKGTERSIGIMNAYEEMDSQSLATILVYNIYVRLPRVENSAQPLYVSRLQADFFVFGIVITDLAGRVEFGDINLKTAYRVIEAESLIAHKARIETEQAPITGNYTVSSSLELLTKNGPIQADITMLTADQPDHPPTYLAMHTTNGGITARLNLSNPSTTSSLSPLSSFFSSESRLDSTSGVGGNFSITTSTTNAPLSLAFLTQPLSSFLSLTARTSSASAKVFLAPQFAGLFKLSTSVLRPALEVGTLPDSKSGRWREVEVTRDDLRSLEGEVIWVDRRGGRESCAGVVDVSTSVLPAILRL